MKAAMAGLAGSLIFLGCGPRAKDPEDFLRRFPTAENRNRLTLVERSLRYEVHVLSSEFLAARDVDWTAAEGSLPQEKSSAFRSAKASYEGALYFLVRLTRMGETKPHDGIPDPELFEIQRHLQSRQESLRQQVRLRSAGREDLRASQVIVSSLPGPKPSITLLVVFPTAEDDYRRWDFLSLAGIEGLPLHSDFRISELRPKLRLVL